MNNATTQHEVKNNNLTQKVIITRSLLSDGYNYYLSLYNFNKESNCWFLNETYTQKNSILSLKKAIQESKTLFSQ